jgi:predicted DNA-binding ribbon-helix-helix protein
VAASEKQPISRLISHIDAERGGSGLSSAVRVWLLAHYRARARRVGS